MWNRGYIRITGPVRNLRSFVVTRLVALDKNDRIVKDAWESIMDGEGRFWTRNVSPVCCHLLGMRKCIISTDDIVACAASEDAVDTLSLPFRKPGDVRASDFLDIAKRYGINIHVYLGNYQESISHSIRIENGTIELDETCPMESAQPRIIFRETYA